MQATKIASLSYIICSNPRSGSTLLCDLLSQTGVAGQPDSFFRRESFQWWADYLTISTSNWAREYEFDQAYLDAILLEGTNGTGVFGMRLMQESVSDLLARLKSLFPSCGDGRNLLESVFGRCLYVYLSREDKIAQAVSLYRAEESGLWHKYSDGRERERLKAGQEPDYDFQVLSNLVRELQEHELAWKSWFTEQDIEPLHLTYEGMSSNPHMSLAKILSALGKDPEIAKAIHPKSAVMADARSREWIARLRIELDRQTK